MMDSASSRKSINLFSTTASTYPTSFLSSTRLTPQAFLGTSKPSTATSKSAFCTSILKSPNTFWIRCCTCSEVCFRSVRKASWTRGPGPRWPSWRSEGSWKKRLRGLGKVQLMASWYWLGTQCFSSYLLLIRTFGTMHFQILRILCAEKCRTTHTLSFL